MARLVLVGALLHGLLVRARAWARPLVLVSAHVLALALVQVSAHVLALALVLVSAHAWALVLVQVSAHVLEFQSYTSANLPLDRMVLPQFSWELQLSQGPLAFEEVQA